MLYHHTLSNRRTICFPQKLTLGENCQEAMQQFGGKCPTENVASRTQGTDVFGETVEIDSVFNVVYMNMPCNNAERRFLSFVKEKRPELRNQWIVEYLMLSPVTLPRAEQRLDAIFSPFSWCLQKTANL